mmetsp:Transcript_55001/g.120610  ORF Transcript_55001/g.120610 Transcript_55001/m.120610 type:complete len:464 (+) Transcript_55001:40-1431(+)|eukprot:CAMPEP_0204362148 /NCGR_PEP_ID=MMETSP0469-20131031/39378_1 /ASSEMBLY_ACC=CAM_ASM_000384 /TAXON_ID=2969 /ORGANISM="Oxyrrhis marina" /LENGTH=463 /DNA_ID=CAMNT_0051350667 /DNA_START=11 /DNA_END=1402 /DNA_ORIENTATION=-
MAGVLASALTDQGRLCCGAVQDEAAALRAVASLSHADHRALLRRLREVPLERSQLSARALRDVEEVVEEVTTKRWRSEAWESNAQVVLFDGQGFKYPQQDPGVGALREIQPFTRGVNVLKKVELFERTARGQQENIKPVPPKPRIAAASPSRLVGELGRSATEGQLMTREPSPVCLPKPEMKGPVIRRIPLADHSRYPHVTRSYTPMTTPSTPLTSPMGTPVHPASPMRDSATAALARARGPPADGPGRPHRECGVEELQAGLGEVLRRGWSVPEVHAWLRSRTWSEKALGVLRTYGWKEGDFRPRADGPRVRRVADPHSTPRDLPAVPVWCDSSPPAQRLVPLPVKRPDENYDLSDKGSDSEEEHQKQHRSKRKPSWVQNWHQLTKAQADVDPDTIFGTHLPVCDLDVIIGDHFYTGKGRERPRLRRRGSSQNWRVDKLTCREVERYKRRMRQHRAVAGVWA